MTEECIRNSRYEKLKVKNFYLKTSIFIFLLVLILFLAFTYFHSGIFDSQKIIQAKITEIKKEETAPLKAVSFVSPHHLVAEKLIDKIFFRVAEENKNSEIGRIILVSPNHFNLGTGWVIASEADWKVGSGTISADKEFIGNLEKKGLAHVENGAFQKEHGIENLLPYAAKYFPAAKIVPLMARDGFPSEKVDALAEEISRNSQGKTILILSADFSHYLEKNISRLHDERAISALKSLDSEKASQLDVDCVPGLQLLMKFSGLQGFENFNPVENSNSSEVLGKNFIGENTSYVTGYYSQGKKQEKTAASLLFFGDLMLDRDVRTLIQRKNSAFITEKIQRLFWSQDLNVANLEGPITDAASISVGTTPEEKSHFAFTFDPGTAGEFLKHNNLNAVSIGNNHILNFKKEGLEETKNNLKNYKIDYFGDPSDKDNYFLKEINGKKISIVSYNQFSGIDVEATKNIIGKLKSKSDFIIVYAHWGTEYELKETSSQKEKARQFIDAGADMIIGSHPHVVEPMEMYKNKIIFYSLGNFVFDQYFSEDTKNMLSVGVMLDQDGLEIALEPLYQGRNGQVILAPEQKRQALLSRLANDSTVDYNMKEEIRNGIIQIQFK